MVLLEQELPPAAPCTPMVLAKVLRDSRDPCGVLRSVPERTNSGHALYEGFLRHILTVVGIVEHGEADGVDAGCVPADEGRVGLSVALRACLYQFCISGLVQSSLQVDEFM